MGIFTNLLELIRDDSHERVADEEAREVAIALAGNGTEVRDRLHKALSTRLESLWSPSPFRLIESGEQPVGEDEDGGLVLYALYEGERIPSDRKEWLKRLVLLPGVSVIAVVLPREETQAFGAPRKRSRVSSLNPLRLIERAPETPIRDAAADGASFNSAPVALKPDWEAELNELAVENILVARLKSYEITEMEDELLTPIVERLKGRELALARRAPIFRNVVADQLIINAATESAQTIMIANVTSLIPLVSGFFDSGSDFVLLTKSQFELNNRLASVYGQKRENRVTLYLELAPVVAGAFVWRAIARKITGELPFLVQILPKGAIAYSCTILVGRVAQIYYANGRQAPAQLSGLVQRVYSMVTGRPTPGADGADSDENIRRFRSS